MEEKKNDNVKNEDFELPMLSEDFFYELLNPPACKSKGYCDNCGRCEH